MPVDRTKTCPFLLQVFCKTNEHHSLESFSSTESLPSSDEVQVYAWPDSTLREIADLVRDVVDEAKGKNSKQSLRLVYPDRQGKPVAVDLGILSNTTKGYIDSLTLSSIKFQTGDYLDVAIYVT
jgi:Sin3 associated polypeptide p18 (SAP18)